MIVTGPLIVFFISCNPQPIIKTDCRSKCLGEPHHIVEMKTKTEKIKVCACRGRDGRLYLPQRGIESINGE
jgi:hypothetical protein